MRAVRRFLAVLPLLLAGAGGFPPAAAQSVVREVPRPSTPFVHSFSPCRQGVPADPVAQRYYQSVVRSDGFRVLLEQLDALRTQPSDTLRAIDAEVYFLLLRQLDFRLSFEPAISSGSGPAAILSARNQGQDLAARFGSDALVHCAWASSELWLSTAFRLREHFDEATRRQARDRFILLQEQALAGRLPIDKAPEVLRHGLGQLLLDRGFGRLPDTAAAEPDFEAGAAHLLRAASEARDERDVSNWTRYAFMLAKLPAARQSAVLQRLLAQAEAPGGWAAQPEASPAALQVWLHLLNESAQTALALRDAPRAVRLYGRYLQLTQTLRRQAPDDPNPVVNQALALLLLADAQIGAGDRRAAQGHLDAAADLYRHAGAAIRDMLAFQDFEQDLARLRARLR